MVISVNVRVSGMRGGGLWVPIVLICQPLTTEVNEH